MQSRREFLNKIIVGSATISAAPLCAAPKQPFPAVVPLGASGLSVSQIAMGTGTHGEHQESKQTRLGEKGFLDFAAHCYDAGITFFDAADSYGSHPYLKTAFKYIPREKITLLTKIWMLTDEWYTFTTAQNAIDRFRKELGVDYIDIVLLHAMTAPNWPQRFSKVCDELTELKVKGIIGSYGISCHSIYALQAAIQSDWTQVIFARLNNQGLYMDHHPQIVVPLLKKARAKGIGIVGMKMFGKGKIKLETERDASMQFVWQSGAVDAVTMGFGNSEQADEALRKSKLILSGKSITG